MNNYLCAASAIFFFAGKFEYKIMIRGYNCLINCSLQFLGAIRVGLLCVEVLNVFLCIIERV